jgi:hypothetical protein
MFFFYLGSVVTNQLHSLCIEEQVEFGKYLLPF